MVLHQVHLDDVDQGKQREVAVVVDEIVQRQGKALLLERTAALDDGIIDGNGLEQFQHHLCTRQQFHDVGQQHVGTEIDKAQLRTQYGLHAHFTECVMNDVGRGLHVVGDRGIKRVAGTKQQFVRDDALVAVEDGLTPQEDVPGCHAYRFRSFHSASTRALTAASITIGVPHSRAVSPGHLLVASIPILPPSPDTGLAKSR